VEKAPAPASLMQLFVTEVYRTELQGTSVDGLLDRVEAACRRLMGEDEPGRAWSQRHGYLGYTSYGSIDALPQRDPAFADLVTLLDAQARVFAALIELDLRGKTLRLQNIWINALGPGGAHSGHTHPHAVFSGTIYLAVPPGSGALQFEDPRLGLMMHAPFRQPNARPYRQTQMATTPQRGTLLLWESWLRHEVTTNRGDGVRISVSFNYDL
jgi:uncharacterized protein (TIGR02466 family)